MSSRAPAREDLTAYQRWELTALRAPARAGIRSTGRAAQPLPTAEDIEGMHQAAHAEGYAAGLAEGRGQAAAESARLQALLAGVTREIEQWEAAIAEDIVSLAIEIAHQVTREALALKRELILPVVREAMQQMPLFNPPARLCLNPADAKLVQEELGEALLQINWKIVEDALVERGGARVESAATRIDATAATRWERAVAVLGRDRAWLERGALARRGADGTGAAL